MTYSAEELYLLSTSDDHLPLRKRVGFVAIFEMEAPWAEVNGKTVKVCLNCGNPLPDGNRKYCRYECSQEFWAKHNQRGLALFAFKRAGGKCERCGWKNHTFDKPFPKRPGWVEGGVKAHTRAMEQFEKELKAWRQERDAWEDNRPTRNFIADHIIPIAIGGAEFDLENIQNLCEVCNRKKTRRDAARIANMRKYGIGFRLFWQNVSWLLQIPLWATVPQPSLPFAEFWDTLKQRDLTCFFSF